MTKIAGPFVPDLNQCLKCCENQWKGGYPSYILVDLKSIKKTSKHIGFFFKYTYIYIYIWYIEKTYAKPYFKNINDLNLARWWCTIRFGRTLFSDTPMPWTWFKTMFVYLHRLFQGPLGPGAISLIRISHGEDTGLSPTCKFHEKMINLSGFPCFQFLCDPIC